MYGIDSKMVNSHLGVYHLILCGYSQYFLLINIAFQTSYAPKSLCNIRKNCFAQDSTLFIFSDNFEALQ